MKKLVYFIFLVFIPIFFSSCIRKAIFKQKTQELLIGTWEALFDDSCGYVLITFQDDGTGNLTYMNTFDSLIINPPCSIAWSIKVNNDLDGFASYLRIYRLEQRCSGCQKPVSYAPDTTVYKIVYIDKTYMKLTLIRGYRMTDLDMFNCLSSYNYTKKFYRK